MLWNSGTVSVSLTHRMLAASERETQNKSEKAKWKSDVHGSEAIKRETINYEAGERERQKQADMCI